MQNRSFMRKVLASEHTDRMGAKAEGTVDVQSGIRQLRG